MKKENKKAKKEKNKNLSLNATKAIEIATKLMPMLADYRASDRNKWMKIGWILSSIGEGSQKAFDLWIEFSAICEDSYDEGECTEKWENMKIGDYTLGSLKYFASIDSPEQYMKYKQKKLIV